LNPLADYVKWEGGNHMVHYPVKTELPSVVQQNGQLMGSLLSFPILSILNAFTVCQATNKSLDGVNALFHGDDVAACMTMKEIEEWKRITSLLGLELSVGKNYISKHFVSIDSGLFTRNQSNICGDFIRQKTGKFRLIQDREDGSLTCEGAFKNGWTKEQIKTLLVHQLESTVRSLDVSSSYGGLSNAGQPESDLERYTYELLLRRKIEIEDHGDFYFTLPEAVTQFVRNHELTSRKTQWEQDVTKQSSERLLKKRVHRLIERKARIPFREYYHDLHEISNITIRCVGKNKSTLQSLVDAIYGINRQPKMMNSQCLKSKRILDVITEE